MLTRLGELQIPARFASDLAVAKALAAAAKTGALENVRINLDTIKDQDFRASVEARLRALNLDE
jgi:formiminotetrahydrofolate cyclodeaminase